MSTLYDGNGNPIQVSGGASSDFGVTNYAVAKDENGEINRAGTLTYGGRVLFPKTTQELVVDVPKDYGGGVMIALGDSYTAAIGDRWDEFATRHNLVCDHQGVVGSAIHYIPDAGVIGYQDRMDTFIANYTGDGQTVGGKVYTADDVKLITVMGGANDGWNDETLGKSIYDTDRGTVYGGCHYIFGKLLLNFPNADIVCILQPIQWMDASFETGITTDEQAKEYGFATKQDVVNLNGFGVANFTCVKAQRIVRECAEWYGVAICDCVFNWYRRIGVKDCNLWREDGHMTSAGYDAVVEHLEKTVNNLPFTRN
jgi:lysophospholipase L1-like esterase